MFAIKKVFSKCCFTITKCFNDAKKEVEKKSYDMVFLDHRLPYNDLGNLEDVDFDKFSESLEYIGYKLIETIKRKNPNTIIVGTSSEKNRAVQCGTPDFNITKQDKKVVVKDLEKITQEALS